MYPMVVSVLSLEYNQHTGKYNYFNFSMAERDVVWQYFPEFVQLRSTFEDVGVALQALSIDITELGFLLGMRLLQDGKDSYFFVQCGKLLLYDVIKLV